MHQIEKIVIRKLDKAEDSLEKLVHLFRSGLGDTDIEYWTWKYFRTNGFDHQRMYVIEEQGRIVAMMGFVPVEYCYLGKYYKAVQMCDLVVHPDFRGRGYFYKICEYAYKEFKREHYDIFVGFPNDKSCHGLEKMNYNFAHMKTYDSAFNFLHIIMKILCIRPRFIPKMRFTAKASEQFYNFEFDKKQTLTSDFARLNINKKFLSWKCEDYMRGEYLHIDVFDGKNMIAYFIVRITKGRHITAAKIVNFDICKSHIEEITEIARVVKKQIYSVADTFGFCGIWNSTMEHLVRKAFVLKKGKCASKVAYKMLSNHQLTNNIFFNHIDTDL